MTAREIAAVGLSVVVLGVLLWPQTWTPRGPSRQSTAINCVKQQLLALLSYEEQEQSFPPAYVAGPAGKPLLSWRVLILPHLDCQNLYREFRLDEPWDSPHNAKLIPKMPEVFASPRWGPDRPTGRTPFLALRGPQTALSGPAPTRLSQVRDGSANTAVIVEVLPEYEVVWTKPDDLDLDAEDFAARLQNSNGRYLFGFLDGSVHAPRRETPADVLRTLGNISDGRVVPFEE